MISSLSHNHRSHGFASTTAPHAVEAFLDTRPRRFRERLWCFVAGAACGYLGGFLALRWPL